MNRIPSSTPAKAPHKGFGYVFGEEVLVYQVLDVWLLIMKIAGVLIGIELLVLFVIWRINVNKRFIARREKSKNTFWDDAQKERDDRIFNTVEELDHLYGAPW